MALEEHSGSRGRSVGGDQQAEDDDTARLVERFQAGDRNVLPVLYARYFDRIYAYLFVALRDRDDAEEATQEIFIRVFEALPRYERRAQPFRAWLFVIVRNYALRELKHGARTTVVDPSALNELNEREGGATVEVLRTLGWITDSDLLLFVERLPLAQVQVLFLRYVTGLPTKDIAAVTGRSETGVRTLEHRALGFLKDRLAALGRVSEDRTRMRMRGTVKTAPVLRHRRFVLTL